VILGNNIAELLPLAYMFDVPNMITWCSEVLDHWQSSAMHQIFRSTYANLSVPDQTVFEAANQLLAFLWSNKNYQEKRLIKFFKLILCKRDTMVHLKIPEECATLLDRMVLIRWDRYFKECKPKLIFYKSHKADQTFPDFMATEKLKIKEKYADEKTAERIYNALFPCDTSIIGRRYVVIRPVVGHECKYPAKHRCADCSQIYCSEHRHACEDRVYKCESCKISIPLCDKFSPQEMCTCGFSKICKELLSELFGN